MAKFMSMAGSGLANLSKALIPLGSHNGDEDIIKYQLQADINSQAETTKTSTSKRQKRKSRDANGFDSSDIDHSRRKKRSGKSKVKQDQKRLYNSKYERTESPESSPNGEDRAEEVTIDTPVTRRPNEAKQNDMSGGELRRASLTAITGRTSLGSNRDALLRSILKGCAPDKSSVINTEHYFSSGSEAEEVLAAPIVSETPNIPSKEKRHRLVSMVPVLPQGYKPNQSGRFHCPVRDCDKIYSRRSTLGEHMNSVHAGEVLNDNLDGSMSVISQEDYQKAILSGSSQVFVEMPNVPLPRKARKAQRPRGNGNKSPKALSSRKSVPQSSQYGDSPVRSTPPISRYSGTSSSEHEISGNVEPSDIEDRPRIGQNSAIRPSILIKSNGRVPNFPLNRNRTTEKVVAPGRFDPTPSNNHKPAPCDTAINQMDDWELDPGVISQSESETSSDSETEHNAAYSSVYIASAKAGVKLSGVHFQLIRIAPGSTAPGPDVPYLRVCSVAAGKVLVRLGEKSFYIGANGMWQVKAGVQCTVSNRYYSEAVIHVSTIKSN